MSDGPIVLYSVTGCKGLPTNQYAILECNLLFAVLPSMSSPSKHATKRMGCLGGLVVALVALGAMAPSLTIQGVPLTMVVKFLRDRPARDAYFAKDKPGLHNRLQELGIEDEIKEFYRPQFSDEKQLDQHIHQVFYDLSGYVGKAYVLTDDGTLRLRSIGFEGWAKLAQQAGVITDSYYGADGIAYVVGIDGTVAPYDTIALLYPLSWLRQQIEIQQRLQSN
ncbi:MAG: hypothetical protein WA902_20925 [Thermosynechococcaceae cyanobacterium]